MSWLKRIKPITLHQASGIPYVILEDGVRLCFDNLYSENKEQSDHNISFMVSRRDLARQTTNYYRLKKFPVTVPFSHILSLDDSIVQGRLIKHAVESSDEPQTINLIKMEFLQIISDDEFQQLVDRIDERDHSFLLVRGEIDPQARLLDDMVTMLYHDDSNWGRTCVAMADTLCQKPDRKYCWTRTLPEMNLHCYGLDNPDNMDDLQTSLDFIGISCAVMWED